MYTCITLNVPPFPLLLYRLFGRISSMHYYENNSMRNFKVYVTDTLIRPVCHQNAVHLSDVASVKYIFHFPILGSCQNICRSKPEVGRVGFTI